ncbi:CidA/LrgA family protein [Pararoseomonas indoligenes]|uniref:CidA/LrgA family protein n=1 Tax=Roseomonas indoligenes TaxID=2820811 RepID=A0A940S6I1_9PROT|nr:CidA/LrgA family protein [Pararoseomonas indoligenes]MBP0494054.1 CidA/LrgA family protein [Pararoseomonas indoligenes]
MIPGAALILLCQLLGEALVHGTGWPLPGPVVGMVLLLLLLLGNDLLADPVDTRFVTGPADGLLMNLTLLFVPAGVGVVNRMDVLAAHWFALAASLVVSTLLGLVVTALVFVAVARLTKRHAAGETEA